MSYYDHPALSQSKLKELKKSPKHFWAKYIEPEREPEVVTDDMKFGKALHHYLLESSSFNNNYIVLPKVDKRTKEGKAIYAEAIEQSEQENKQLIDEADMKIIKKMATSFFNKKMSKILDCKGLFEKELFWRDDDFGIDCKAKPDFFIEPNNIFKNGLIVDVKTTQDATPDIFSRSIDKYGYYNQAGFYCQAIKQIYETEGYPQFIIIAMEKTSPFEISFFEMDALSIDLGIQENNKLMHIYKECTASGIWRGYADELHTISLPSWAINRLSNN
jgi:exodeoxyribonuclease VIII